jgi:hypothetical protein
MLQRLRAACGNDHGDDNQSGGTGGSFLRCIVETEETYIHGKKTNKHERRKLKAGRGVVPPIYRGSEK